MQGKHEIRRMIWDRLLKAGVARPPLPPHGRIPNFAGAGEAAARITGLPAWRSARLVKVNPDSPQRPVRLRALSEGKLLLMPTPRLKRGFLLLDPSRIPRSLHARAATIRGAFRHGVLLDTVDALRDSIDRVDMIVEGSVAVDPWGGRLGKGEGYAELEYAILRELELAGEETPIATSVHDLQLVDFRLPQDPYDVPVDYIATPTRLLRSRERRPRPPGILWELLSEEKLREIPLLAELRRYKGL